MSNVHGIDEELLSRLKEEIEFANTLVSNLEDGTPRLEEGETIKENLYCFEDIGDCIQKLVDQIFEQYGSMEIKEYKYDNLQNSTLTESD